MRLLRKRNQKVGAPPGSLIYTGERALSPITVHLTRYAPQEIEHNENATLSDCVAALERPGVVWVHVKGIHDPLLVGSYGQAFHLHPLLIEDVLNPSQPCKLDQYKDVVFIILKYLKIPTGFVEEEQISLVFNQKCVLSFQENHGDPFFAVRERLNKNEGGESTLRNQGADFLAYALIDSIVDQTFVVLEGLDTQLDQLEEEIFNRPRPKTLHQIQYFKRQISILRRSLWPMREVVSRFQRLEGPITDTTRLYIHDVYDHIIQAIETLESFRDVVGGMLDIYLSSLNQRMNEIIKVLTIVSTVFTPITFIASVYGMNFIYMPELQYKWAYPAVLLLMLACALSMLAFFRRRSWI